MLSSKGRNSLISEIDSSLNVGLVKTASQSKHPDDAYFLLIIK